MSMGKNHEHEPFAFRRNQLGEGQTEIYPFLPSLGRGVRLAERIVRFKPAFFASQAGSLCHVFYTEAVAELGFHFAEIELLSDRFSICSRLVGPMVF